MKTRRMAALLLALTLLFVMLCAAVLPAHTLDHDCAGEGCAICAAVAVCRTIVKILCLSAVCVIRADGKDILSARAACAFSRVFPTQTLVGRKTKLTD